jgi:hypothetical protein
MWWWILVWALLLLGAAVVVGLLGWYLIRRGIALGRQLGQSAEDVSGALAPILDHYEPAHSVLVDPSTLPETPRRRSGRGGVGSRLRRVD